jgi:hypothetical protein
MGGIFKENNIMTFKIGLFEEKESKYTGKPQEIVPPGRYQAVLHEISQGMKEKIINGKSLGLKPHFRFHFWGIGDHTFKVAWTVPATVADRSRLRAKLKEILLFASAGDFDGIDKDAARLTKYLEMLVGCDFVVELDIWTKPDGEKLNIVKDFYPHPKTNYPSPYDAQSTEVIQFRDFNAKREKKPEITINKDIPSKKEEIAFDDDDLPFDLDDDKNINI